MYPVRRSHRAAALAAVALTASGALTAGLAYNAAADPVEEPQGIDWQPCADKPEFDCATVEVPLDYADPGGETIKIGLARQEATDPDERIGSILMDPGGPGRSGVDAVLEGANLSSDVAERFDLIGFDPRGVNTSTPVQCDPELFGAVASLPVPSNAAEFEARVAANDELAADCRERTGPLLDHLDTRHVVEDMERIRRALGEGELNYLGYSYGTLFGQQYAEAYPGSVRAMVLDGDRDHSLETMWDFMSDETAAFEENFDAFADWCDATADCALFGEDTRAVYAELKDRARAGALTDPGTGEPIGFEQLTEEAFTVNDPNAWSDAAARLLALRDGRTGSGAAETEADFAALPILCSDWEFELGSYEELADLQTRLASEYPDVEWTRFNSLQLNCLGDAIATTNPQRPLEITEEVPIVHLGTRHDYAAVYPWNVSAAEQTGGVLLTYEGYGHTQYYDSAPECLKRPLDTFFIEGTEPAPGLTCPA